MKKGHKGGHHPEIDAKHFLFRQRELAAVSIKEEDIDLIVNELEITRTIAEVTLREHKGDVVAALRHLISV
jgi:NACalpha-BTF3-like transcription factor